MDISSEKNVRRMENASNRNVQVQGTDITCKRNAGNPMLVSVRFIFHI